MNNSDIVNGSMLMVFLNGSAIGFATSHSLSMTLNTSEISTKDHGEFPAVVPQSIGWEVTAENLYTTAGEATYMGLITNKTEVQIVFAPASNYNDHGLNNGAQGSQGPQSWSQGTPIASGMAYVTSFSINAPAGENATMSVTFTGNGALNTGSNNG